MYIGLIGCFSCQLTMTIREIAFHVSVRYEYRIQLALNTDKCKGMCFLGVCEKILIFLWRALLLAYKTQKLSEKL